MLRSDIYTCRYLGCAGSGKTESLISVAIRESEQLGDPTQVGYVSFTRAACDEAAMRVGRRCSISKRRLRRGAGLYRTLHGISLIMLMADGLPRRAWYNAVCHTYSGTQPARWRADLSLWNSIATGDVDNLPDDADDYVIAAAVWHCARQRLVHPMEVWREIALVTPSVPSYGEIAQCIMQYEQSKQRDGRVDFTDLLMQFAGFTHDSELNIVPTTPRGSVPQHVRVWILDEAQDCSPLMWRVFARLVNGGRAVRACYLGGDPYQAIYAWAGASPDVLLRLNTADTVMLHTSWRCPERILNLGETQLKLCSGYSQRGLSAAKTGGVVQHYCDDSWLVDVAPTDDWLILARTNYVAEKLGALLTGACIPWHAHEASDVGSCWETDTTMANILVGEFAARLSGGKTIRGSELRRFLRQFKKKMSSDLLTRIVYRGTIEHYEMVDDALADMLWPSLAAADLPNVGIRPEFVQAITDGSWVTWLPEARCDVAAAVRKWGADAVMGTRVRVSTIHRAKGCEADNVVLCLDIPARVKRGAELSDGRDAERRVWYVGVTRAKERLCIVGGGRYAKYAWDLGT